jgi:hypothetical protein
VTEVTLMMNWSAFEAKRVKFRDNLITQFHRYIDLIFRETITQY